MVVSPVITENHACIELSSQENLIEASSKQQNNWGSESQISEGE